MSVAEEQYKLAEGDALGWLEQARGELLSADVIYKAFVEIMPLSQTLPGIRERKLAYMQSFMLLTALAFENVLKGVAVAEEPTAWKRLRAEGGHGISDFAAEVITLSDAERNLLQRLQEYSVWAGRYIIPTKAARYASNFHLLNLRGDDPLLISALFERFASILHARVEKRA